MGFRVYPELKSTSNTSVQLHDSRMRIKGTVHQCDLCIVQVIQSPKGVYRESGDITLLT